MIPFYNPALTYADNYQQGPFGLSEVVDETGKNIPFGIPAGPLLNANYCANAFRAGYDICVYKTVREKFHPVNEFPNVLYSHAKDKSLSFAEADTGVLADANQPSQLNQISISNSFGVPSADPDIWQPDMARAKNAAGKRQVLVGSFQGTGGVKTFVHAAKLVAETGVEVMEMNTSCPNEGKDSLLCFAPELVGEITAAVKEEIGNIPLFIKIGYLREAKSEEIDIALLQRLLKNTVQRGTVQGISAINTIPTRLVDAEGNPALLGLGRETSGVCGASIKWAGLKMTRALSDARKELTALARTPAEEKNAQFKIAGVGGVMTPEDYFAYLDAGADEVLAATGPMYYPKLALDIKNLT